jgi:ubiquinone/menaquinone biosynthesis C-methylase UbiE
MNIDDAAALARRTRRQAGERLVQRVGIGRDEDVLEVEWVEGAAEALPFPDESFDVVLSALGGTVGRPHAAAATELVRVLRPGGRLGLCDWTREDTQDHLRELFAGADMYLEFERETVFAERNEPVEYLVVLGRKPEARSEVRRCPRRRGRNKRAAAAVCDNGQSPSCVGEK